MLNYNDGFSVHNNVHSKLIKDSVCGLSPMVSIMIPTYRRPALLREAVESALQQITSLSFEVVVIDNEADPEMARSVNLVIESFDAPNLRLFRNEKNIGMYGNWNRCVELSRAKWLTILNDDDLLRPTFIETVWKARQGNAMIAVNYECFGRVIRSHPVVQLFKPLYYYFRDIWRYRNGIYHVNLYDIIKNHPLQGSLGVLFNKDFMIQIGGYNEAYGLSSDYEFTVRYWLNEDVIFLAEKLAAYRYQENESLKVNTLRSWTLNTFRLRNELIGAMRIERKRKEFLLCLSRIQTRLDAYYYRRRVNSSFDPAGALKDLGLPVSEHQYFIMLGPLMRVLWRLALLNFGSLGTRMVEKKWLFGNSRGALK